GGKEEGLLPLRAPLWLVPAFVRSAGQRRRRQDRGKFQERRPHRHAAEDGASTEERKEDRDQKGLIVFGVEIRAYKVGVCRLCRRAGRFVKSNTSCVSVYAVTPGMPEVWIVASDDVQLVADHSTGVARSRSCGHERQDLCNRPAALVRP